MQNGLGEKPVVPFSRIKGGQEWQVKLLAHVLVYVASPKPKGSPRELGVATHRSALGPSSGARALN